MPSVYRNENKYNLTDPDMWMMENRISKLLRADSHNGGKYFIKSLYFDDVFESSYLDSLNGNPDRCKYRIRMYGDSTDIIKLEVKKKHYSLSTKLTSSITVTEMDKLISGRTIRDYDNLEDPRTLFNIAIMKKGLKPVLWIGYERSAYVHQDGDVRVTFDRKVGFNGHISGCGKKYFEQINPSSVLEVKYTNFIPKSIFSALENNRMIKTAYSKYALCMEKRKEIFECR